jgi:hypothetical protein
MEIVQIVGIVVAAVVILVLAYLYRENAIVEGKTEWGIGPIKFSLGGKTQKQVDAPVRPTEPSTPKIEQSATGVSLIQDSAPEIHGGVGEIKQTAANGGVITGSGPKIS